MKSKVPMLLVSCHVAVTACDRSTDKRAAAEAPASSVSASPEVTPKRSCRRAAVRHTLRGTTTGTKSDVRPSLIVGDAVVTSSGYAIALLASAGRTTHASVALVPKGVDGAREVDLGPVHGDVPPPAVAASSDALFAAVSDGDASGGSLRVARVDLAAGSVAWSADLHEGNDDSREVSLGVSEGRMLVVWDAWYRESGRGILSFSSAPEGDLGKISEPQALLADERSLSAPRLATDRGGHWLAYLVANGSNAGTSEKELAERAKRVASGEAWVEERPAQSVELLRLDASGKATARPIVVSDVGEDVSSFDLVAVGGDAAVVAWRSSTPTGGAGGEISASIVRADGSIAKQRVEAERLGPGEPSLLPASDAGAWLSVAADDDRIQLGWLPAVGAPGGLLRLEGDEELGGLVPMADGGTLLVLEQGEAGPVVLEVSCDRR